MKFLQLIQYLEQHIGHHQFPLRAGTTSYRQMVDSCALHYELVTRVVSAVYSANNCRHLHDTVMLDTTFEALAPIRRDLMNSPRTDVDSYRLIEDIGEAVARGFAREARAAPRRAIRPSAIIPFPIPRRLKFPA